MNSSFYDHILQKTTDWGADPEATGSRLRCQQSMVSPKESPHGLQVVVFLL